MLTVILGLIAQVQAPVRPAEIIIIRHAEKPAKGSDPHLSKTGRDHAARIATYFTTNPAMTQLGRPVAIFATKTTKDDDGQRTQETVAPLAAALKLPVQTPFLGKDYQQLAKAILANPAFAGKTVFICWNHEEIPQLVAALGVSPAPPSWKGEDYSTVYAISYRGGRAVLTRTGAP